MPEYHPSQHLRVAKLFFLSQKSHYLRLLPAVIFPRQENRRECNSKMDALQVALPILGIFATAAVTFYAVSFAEIREKSVRELDESESESGGFKSSLSSRDRRAKRRAEKQESSRG